MNQLGPIFQKRQYETKWMPIFSTRVCVPTEKTSLFSFRQATKRIPNVAPARVLAELRQAELVDRQQLGASNHEKCVDKTTKNLQLQHILSFCTQGLEDKMHPAER